VFTGGPSLHRAKQGRHPNVHCFPSSVDLAHFGQARRSGLDHAGQAGKPRPRLGFFGVIDERLDLPLLDALVRARPDWQLMMVGPVTKISPRDLPQAPNLHYFGQRAYAELPAFLAGWDVCLLPFALNDATRYISPTKTLEYMAAEKPIVSTPITDVAEPYGAIVHLGEGIDAFVAACGHALTAPETDTAERVGAMRKMLLNTSWDATARAMAHEIAKVLHGRDRVPRPASRDREGYHSAVVVGAGPTGLSAAYHLPEALLLEAGDSVGGWCRSIEENGFTFDYAGHIMFSNDDDVQALYRELLGDNLHWQDREAWITGRTASIGITVACGTWHRTGKAGCGGWPMRRTWPNCWPRSAASRKKAAFEAGFSGILGNHGMPRPVRCSAQISTLTLISMTCSAGIWKKSGAWAAFRSMKANSFSRHKAMPGAGVGKGRRRLTK